MTHHEHTIAKDTSDLNHEPDRLADLPEPVRDVCVLVIEELRRSMDHLFRYIDDRFCDLADRADRAVDRSTYLDIFRDAKLYRTTICDRVIYTITESVLIAWSNVDRSNSSGLDATQQSFSSEDMSILSDEELRVSVASMTVINRGELRCGKQLGGLTSTLNSISRCKPVNKLSNPLGISSITQSFIRIVADSFPKIDAQVCLLQLFENEVVCDLERVYSAALQQLEGSGIEIASGVDDTSARQTDLDSGQPDLPSQAPESHDSSRQGEESRSLDGKTTPKYMGAVQHGAMEFGELQRLLPGAAQTHGASSFTRTPDHHTVAEGRGFSERSGGAPVAYLLNVLATTQGQYLEKLAEYDNRGHRSFPSPQAFLMGLPKEQGGFRNAGKTEQDTLRFVSDLFEHLFRNENLSLSSIALIARLQMPVLRLALLDKSIFGNVDHPARKLINRIAIDGIGWPNIPKLLKTNRVYVAAQALVQSINDEFTDDVSIFQRALDDWNGLIARKRSRSEGAERRLSESALGKAKLVAARTIVQQLIKGRVGDAMLPKTVVRFIADAWTKTLVLTCINSGTGSEGWQSLCATFDDLVSVCEATRNDEVSLERDVPSLAARLREGLEISNSIGFESIRALNNVVAVLEGRHQDEDVGFPEDFGQTIEGLHDLQGPATEADATDESLLDRLHPGTWIEIDRSGRDGPLRCRLVVLVDQSQTYVFANHEGLKVFEKSRAEVARGLTTGNIRIIHEDMFVERAMSELVGSLKSAGQKAASQVTVPVKNSRY